MKKGLCIAIFLFGWTLAKASLSKPRDTSVCEGNAAIFSCTSKFHDSLYRWQYSSGSTWINISGSKNDTLVLSAVSYSWNNRNYRCIIDSNATILDSSQSAILTVLTFSLASDSIMASVNPLSCPGHLSKLSIAGGLLGSGATWQWFENSCGGNMIGQGDTLMVQPYEARSYLVRAKGMCNTTPCDSIKIILSNSLSSPPQQIVNSKNWVCPGEKVTLTVIGGNLGTLARWMWYDSCGGKSIDSGTSIQVQPLKDTSVYWVRAVGMCNQTPCDVMTKVVRFGAPQLSTLPDKAICSGASAKLKATIISGNPPYAFEWSPSMGLSLPYADSTLASPLLTTHYLLTVTDKNSCKNFDTLVVKVNALPLLKSNTDTGICIGDSASLKVGGALQYLWSPVIGLNNASKSNPRSSPPSNTLYTVTGTDGNNCKGKTEIKVYVHPRPKAYAGEDVTICQGEKVQLKAEGGDFYLWNNPNILNSIHIPNPIANPSSTLKLKVLVSNSFGCRESDSLWVTVKPLPTINAGRDTALCMGGSLELNASGGKTYFWFPSLGLSETNKANVTATPLSSTTYVVTSTDLNGCVNSDSIKVKIHPLPILSTTNDTAICESGSVLLKTTANHTFYEWKVNGTVISNALSVIVNPPLKGATYQLSVRDQNNCQGMDSVVVSVSPLPKTKILTSDSVVCRNYSWARYGSTSLNISYLWAVDSGTILTGQGTPHILVQWSDRSTKGLVKLTETLTSKPACFANAQIAVTLKKEMAPSRANIVAKANNLQSKTLICLQCNFKNYEWGFEEKRPGSPETITCTGSTWCTYASLDTNTYLYWMRGSDNKLCATKSYFNPPRLIGRINTDLSGSKLDVFPNPGSGTFHVESKFPIQKVLVFNPMGQLVYETWPNNRLNLILEMDTRAKGVYVLMVHTDRGILSSRLLIK